MQTSPEMVATHPSPLDPTPGLLRLMGPAASDFLQGQVTQDLRDLPVEYWTRAALCTAQGRVLALLKVLRVPDGLWLLMPAERVAPVRTHLQRFVLRTKVQLLAAAPLVVTVETGPTDLVATTAASHHAPVEWRGEARVLALSTNRRLVVSAAAAGQASVDPAGWAAWIQACVADEEPEVFTASAASWTPHMLAQDRWQAISLTKGCYTGQEIVARTHYLGKNKRRLERVHWATTDALPSPGAALDLPDGRRGEWVLGLTGAQGTDGLVVTTLPEAPTSA